MAFRPFLLTAALLPMSLVACGGGDEDTIVPEGEHYHYVVNKASVPTSNTEARDYGLDLDGDGVKDNQLGSVLSLLVGQGLDIQSTIDSAVAEGSIILLVDFQTKDFASTTAAGIQVFLGDNEMPAACMGTEEYDPDTGMGCQHHLDGNGSFSIAAGSPQNAALGGKIAGGTFTGGPGDVALQIALGGTEAIQLNLIGARAVATGITDSAIGSATSGGVIIGGAVTKQDIDTQVIPAIQKQLIPTIAETCTNLSSPPACGCADGSTGETIINLFDKNPVDCMVSVTEITSNALIMGVLAPDVEIDGQMALSIGLKATAVKATFTAPGQ